MPGSPSPSVARHRAHVAAAARWRQPDDPQLAAAQAELRIAVLSQHIAKVLRETPLTVQQREALAATLMGGIA